MVIWNFELDDSGIANLKSGDFRLAPHTAKEVVAANGLKNLETSLELQDSG